MKKMQPNYYRCPYEPSTSWLATKRSLRLLTLTLLLFISVCRVSAQTVYANEYSGVIHTMDMRQCELTYLCTSLMFGDIAWQAGNLYGIQGLSLYTIDTANGSTILVAAASQGISMPGMVGDGAGNLYLGDYSGNLQKFSISNNTFSVVGNVGTTCSGDLVKLGDTIYMIGAGLTLVKITLNPFASTIIGTLNFGGTNPKAYGMTHSAWIDTLIVSVSYTGVNKLFKVNTNNASVTVFCDSLTAVPSQIFGMATDAEDINIGSASFDEINHWEVYPNPACDHMMIQLPQIQPDHYLLKIFNMQGGLILVENIEHTGTYRLDLNALSEGLYVLSIQDKDQQKSFKIAVVREM